MPRDKDKQYKYPFFAQCAEYTLKQDAIDNLLKCAAGKPPKGIIVDYDNNTVSIKRGKKIKDTVILDQTPRVACREMMSIFTKLSADDTDMKPNTDDTCDDVTETPTTWEILQSTEMGQQALRRYLEKQKLSPDEVERGMRLVMVSSFVNLIRDANVDIRRTTNGYRIKNIDVLNITNGRVELNIPTTVKDRKTTQSKTTTTYTDLSRPIISV